MAFDSAVNPPGAASFTGRPVDFSALADLPTSYYQGADQARQQDIATAFKGGLPRDAQGNPDYRAIMAVLAQKGGINAVGQLAPVVQQQQQMREAAQPSPLFGGGPGGTPPAPGPQPAAAPQPSPPAPVVPPQPQPVGADGEGGGVNTVAGLAIGRGLNPDSPTGQAAITNLAKSVGVPPDQPLTPEQQEKATRGIEAYAQRKGITAPQQSPFPGGQQQGQPQGQPQWQPLVPVQMPTDPATGQPFTDPNKAMTAIRREIVRLGRNSYNQPQVGMLNDMLKQIEAARKPLHVGDRLVDPLTGNTVYQATAPIGGEALTAAAENWFSTGKFPPNLRGPQGRADQQAIQDLGMQFAHERGVSAEDLPTRWQQFATHAAGLRVLEARAANMTLVEEETKTLIPRVREASAKVSRTEYPDLNRIILAAKQKTGNQDVIKFGIAAESLIPVYARLLKPTGTIGVTDTENARHILNKAWSDGQIGAALDQMEIERSAAKEALAEARKNFGLPSAKKSEPAAAPAGGSSGGGEGWTTLPNGVRIREKK